MKVINKYNFNKISQKILFVICIPILIIIILFGYQIKIAYVDYLRPSSIMKKHFPLIAAISNLSHDIAVERGLSTIFIASGADKNSKIYKKLLKQRKIVDRDIVLFEKAVRKIEASDDHKFPKDLLLALRKQVDNKNLKPLEVLNKYTKVIKLTLKNIDKIIVEELEELKFEIDLISLKNFLCYKDAYGRESGLASSITAVVRNKNNNKDTLKKLLIPYYMINQEEKTLFDTLKIMMFPKIKKIFLQAHKTEEYRKVEKIKKYINNHSLQILKNYDPLKIFGVYENFLKVLKQCQKEYMKLFKERVSDFSKKAIYEIFLLFIMELFLIVILLFVFSLRKKLEISLKDLKRILSDVEQGKFSVSISNKISNDEFGEIESMILNMVNRFKLLVDEISKISEKISKGDFSINFNKDVFVGDLKIIENNLKRIIFTFENFIKKLDEVTKNFEKGNFDFSISSEGFEGKYKLVVEKLNSIVKMLKNTIDTINKILSELAKGNYAKYDNNLLPGDLKLVIDSINTVSENTKKAINTLKEFLEEANVLSQVNVEEFKGEFKLLGEAANKFAFTMKNLMEEVKRFVENIKNGNFHIDLDSSKFPASLKSLKQALEDVKVMFLNLKEAIFEVNKNLAKGNLNVKMDENQFKGELKDIATYFNKAISSLRKSISESISTLKETVILLEKKVEELASTMQKIEEQTKYTQDITAEVSEVSHDMRILSQEISKINQLSNFTLERVNQAEKVMESVKQTLKSRTKELASIVEIILQIAEQTNMLALNAAIEAARAGEHGRGFAVVADEVRKLAQKVVSATDQIKDTISNLNKDIQVKVIENIFNSFKDIKKSMESLEQIVENTVKISEKDFQKIDYISKNVKELSELAIKNLEELQEVVDCLIKLANKIKLLEEKLKQFKV